MLPVLRPFPHCQQGGVNKYYLCLFLKLSGLEKN